MQVLRDLSPLVEPLSLDEAFVDLAAAGLPDLEVATVTEVGEELRRRVHEVTGGLTATVGIASSKFLAKVASELDKPDGMTVVAARQRARPAAADEGHGHPRRRPGDHRAAAAGRDPHHRRARAVSEDELVRLLGQAQGHGLWQLARAQDSRPVVAEREAKSISVEGTYDTDLNDRKLMEGLLTRQAKEVGTRMRKNGFSGRTVSIKVRLHDFTTLSRSSTLSSPTDDGATIGRIARALLGDLDTTGGVRLLGVGVSGLADWVQEDLFGDDPEEEEVEVTLPEPPARTWPPAPTSCTTRWGRAGCGARVRRGDRPLRDRRDAARPGAQLPGRRPGLHRSEPPPED